MANYRLATLLASKTISTAGTEVIDILEQDPISRIDFRIRLTGSGTAVIGHPALVITKIELVDGSDVLFSLSGKQARAMAIYGSDKLPADSHQYLSGVQAITNYHIYFGRWLWDPKYALDPKRFTSLQLKITHNKALGGLTPSAMTIAIWARTFDERRITPMGFMMSKELRSYVGANATWEQTDLPLDHPYRQILIEAEEGNSNPNSVVGTIRLLEDNGKKVPIEETNVSDYLKMVAEQFTPITEWVQAVVSDTTDKTGYCMVSYLTYGTISPSDTVTQKTGSIGNIQGGEWRARMESEANATLLLRGSIPHGIFPLMVVGDLMDDSDWYDVRGLGNVQLRTKGGSQAGNATTAILTQQVRNY